MGKTYDQLDDKLAEFLLAQHVFFVATAPLAADGHVNLSPKGLDSFRVLGPREVAYLDLVGSGVETIAHARENGRITILFTAFEGPPRIVRLHGRATVVDASEPGFPELAARFPPIPGARAIVRVELQRIADSCGYGVPRFRFEGERTQLVDYAERKGPAGLVEYQKKHNLTSLDGLPGVRLPPAT
ncbi:MAG: pyridoxamine 5'-phosphate oxidase family protein [Planctomycetes bacterium]|nr:pyridoxamine 5'-phosphate oxidase family protein [Planctomycetota bacterium]